MKRSSRKSTQEKSRELAVKLEQRQLKSIERKARLENKKVDKASREEAHELAEVVPKPQEVFHQSEFWRQFYRLLFLQKKALRKVVQVKKRRIIGMIQV